VDISTRASSSLTEPVRAMALDPAMPVIWFP